MQTACLYIRVSTDEQALKGYSQRNQSECLARFCSTNNVDVLDTVFEDHSAKTFDRPAWNNLLSELKQHKKKRPDLVLFTRWDRFSRNSGDAYLMINQLNAIDIQVQAIDQPLDLSIPENKMMLAMYLALSEVENDRRSINIRQGMHKAKQEGRWTGKAPKGYANKISENGRKCIVPYDPEANVIKKIFLQLSEKPIAIRQLHRQLLEQGFKCSLNNLWCMIRNPIYCGKIKVPESGKDNSYLVTGAHQALVSEELFEKVQRQLHGSLRKTLYHNKLNAALPFRGTLLCPVCQRILTGSSSKGRRKYYTYYHCRDGCSFRMSADLVHAQFQSAVKEFIPQPAIVKVVPANTERNVQNGIQHTIIETVANNNVH